MSRVSDGQLVIGQIGLAEAGNLGDDLILIAVVRAIAQGAPGARVRWLSHGLPIDWGPIRERLLLDVELDPLWASREPPQAVTGPGAFRDCSGVVFGGGGLLQTTHHPFRPYHWLRYLGFADKRPPVIAAGLGLGPLSAEWLNRLSSLPPFFDECWVRDDASLRLAQEFGWRPQRCLDFVDDDFMSALGFPHATSAAEGRLGVALRAWPGLDVDDVARHITRIARQTGLDRAEFFVLESTEGSGPDVDFSSRVGKALRLPNSMTIYNSKNLDEVISRMSECPTAISMKLHASILWGHSDATLYPIIYAPKVAAHFDRPYGGLEVLEQEAKPQVLSETATIPSAATVVRNWVVGGMVVNAETRALSLPAHLELGLRSNAHGVCRRLRPKNRHQWHPAAAR